MGNTDTINYNAYVDVDLDVPVSLTVAGLGTFTISDPIDLVSNTFSQNVVLGYLGGSVLTATVGDGSYDLSTNYGPVTGAAGVYMDRPVATSGGNLTYTLTSDVATYTASIGGPAPGAVPEVATWAMMILGVSAVGYAMRRQKVATRISYAV